ncbi:type-1 angiotensin II receptor-like [Ostrea edulis]|uniref:type-1 angiotensin II receptor-like n=1 Tax=Ostrea edulis TaxID=37623 RepID=UPI0024AF9995|nr:type-1 angiotensin II receptor-like [Ostrea edulis]
MNPFGMNTTVEYGNGLQEHFKTSRHYCDENVSKTEGYYNVLLNSTTNTDISGNETQAVSGNNANIPILFFTLDNFRSASSEIIAVTTLVIGTLGLVGNLFTILKITIDKKFHTPTFAVIGCLSFADFLSIVRCYVVYFTTLPSLGHGVQVSTMLFMAFEASYFSSLGHMMLLSVVRYLMTVHPLQSRSHLTTLVVILWSVMVWILSLLLSSFEALYITILLAGQIENLSTILNWSVNIRSLFQVLFPFCTIITLHCLKMKYLRSSQVRTNTRRKMNLIITVILSVFLTSQSFIMVLNLMELLRSHGIFKSYVRILEFLKYFIDLTILLQFVHFSCNPYIYFLISFCF